MKKTNAKLNRYVFAVEDIPDNPEKVTVFECIEKVADGMKGTSAKLIAIDECTHITAEKLEKAIEKIREIISEPILREIQITKEGFLIINKHYPSETKYNYLFGISVYIVDDIKDDEIRLLYSDGKEKVIKLYANRGFKNC